MVSSDEQLIERYLAGDTESFNGLVRRWEKRIYNFTLRYCGSREDAQDLSQEVFTSVFQRLSGLKDQRRFAPWLYTIALNCCRMRHRSGKGRQSLPLDAPEWTESLEAEVSLNSDSQVRSSPEASLGRMEHQELLKHALASLSDEQRVVILLKEYEGLKFHEIAEILECPLSTVKSRLYVGFRALRAFLEQRGLTP